MNRLDDTFYNMLHTISRTIKFSGQSMWRNIWLSTTTVATIALTALSINFAIVLHIGIDQIIAMAEDRINITIYFYPNVTDSQVDGVAEAVRLLEGVTSVVAITPDEALEEYKQRAGGDINLLRPLAVLDENPFGSALVVRAHSVEAYERVMSEFEQSQYATLVESQQKLFEENRRFIATFTAMTQRLKTVVFGVSAFFALITLLLVYNTIRIAIYSHRREIAIMRLVGATNWFIRAPFLLEVTVYAMLAVVGAVGLFLVILQAVEPRLVMYFGADSMRLYNEYVNVLPVALLAQFIALSLLSLFSATVAIRRYLKT